MTDYPAHIGAAAKALAEKHGMGSAWVLDPRLRAAMCEALTMETVPEPVDPLMEALMEAISEAIGEYIMPDATWGCLPDALAKRGLHIAPIPAPVSEERIEEMAREVWADSCRRTSASPLDIIRAGIKRGLAERGEGK